MKKFLSIALALVLMLAMMVPALAVDLIVVSSVVNEEEDVVTEVVGGDEGDYAVISEPEVTQEELEDAQEVINDIPAVQEVEEAGGDTVAIALQVELYDADGNNISEQGGTVVVPKDEPVKALAVLAVLAFKNGSWHEVTFEDLGDSLAITADSFCPIIVVYGDKAESDSGEPVAPQPTGTVVSPQTGDSTALWTVLAIAMVACAGVCFVSARKVSAK